MQRGRDQLPRFGGTDGVNCRREQHKTVPTSGERKLEVPTALSATLYSRCLLASAPPSALAAVSVTDPSGAVVNLGDKMGSGKSILVMLRHLG